MDDNGQGEGSATANIFTDGSTDGGEGCSNINSGKEEDTYVYFRIKLDCPLCRENESFPKFVLKVVKKEGVDDSNFFADNCKCVGNSVFPDGIDEFEEETLDKYGLIVRTKQPSGDIKVTVAFNVQQANFFPSEEPTASPTEEPTDEPTEEPTVEPTDEPTDEPTEEPTASPTTTPQVPDECHVCPNSDDLICNDEFGLTNGLSCKEFEDSLALDFNAGTCATRKNQATTGDSCGRSVEVVCGCGSSCPYTGDGANCDI